MFLWTEVWNCDAIIPVDEPAATAEHIAAKGELYAAAPAAFVTKGAVYFAAYPAGGAVPLNLNTQLVAHPTGWAYYCCCLCC